MNYRIKKNLDMKKLVTVICLIGMMAFSVKNAEAQDTRIGLKGGVTYYKGTINFAGFEESSNSALGFSAGIYAEFPLSDYISVQPEVLYSQKSIEEEDEFLGGSNQTTFSYIDVPVLLRVNIPLEGSVSPFVTAGPYAGYLMDAKNDLDEQTEDISEYIEDLSYGVLFGAGVQFGNFNVEVRYDMGLSNIYNEDLFMDEFNDLDDFDGLDDSFDFGDLFGDGTIEGKLSGLSATVGISF